MFKFIQREYALQHRGTWILSNICNELKGYSRWANQIHYLEIEIVTFVINLKRPSTSLHKLCLIREPLSSLHMLLNIQVPRCCRAYSR
jgi:hypothetical protein